MAETMDATQFVRTLPDRCRVCYSCVRSCPAKAIRIVDGQADVIASRCIGCGHCVRVCSQKAKVVVSAIEKARELLTSGRKTAALVAPSFPAEFSEITTSHFVGMLRKLGFSRVLEVAFGADVVARKHRETYHNGNRELVIEASCPAVVSFIEKYHPNLIEYLAPIVSPMVATGRLAKQRYGSDLACIFIGPCVAKKGEAERFSEDVDCAITFVELRRLFEQAGVDATNVTPSEFDPPHARNGGVYPLPPGMFHTAGIQQDLFTHDTISACGREQFVQAIHDIEQGDINTRFFEMLACPGCIMGAGMSQNNRLHARETQVAHVARERKEMFDIDRWKAELDAASVIFLERTFTDQNQTLASPDADRLAEILRQMGKFILKMSSTVVRVDMILVWITQSQSTRDSLKIKCVYHIQLKNSKIPCVHLRNPRKNSRMPRQR